VGFRVQGFKTKLGWRWDLWQHLQLGWTLLCVFAVLVSELRQLQQHDSCSSSQSVQRTSGWTGSTMVDLPAHPVHLWFAFCLTLF
jgi:hypothetical protein